MLEILLEQWKVKKREKNRCRSKNNSKQGISKHNSLKIILII